MTQAKTVGLACACVGLAAVVVLAVVARSERPIELTLLRIENLDNSNFRRIEVQFRKCASNRVCPHGKPSVQYRIGGRWTDPEEIPQLFAFSAGTNRQVFEFATPLHADRCRFLVDYGVVSPVY